MEFGLRLSNDKFILVERVMILTGPVCLPPNTPGDLYVILCTDPLITISIGGAVECIVMTRLYYPHLTSHYRCFVYKQIHNGYQLSQSAEARCNLYTATEGYRTMTLTKCKIKL